MERPPGIRHAASGLAVWKHSNFSADSRQPTRSGRTRLFYINLWVKL